MVIDLVRRIRSRLDGTSSIGSGRELELQSDAVAADFDEVFYALHYPDVVGDLRRHYFTRGWVEGKDPAPWFSTSSYLESYPDVALSGLNPFYHFIQHGRGEGRITAPSRHQPSDRAWEFESIQRGLDEKFYAAQLKALGIDAPSDLALHYWREGVRLGLDPTSDFSTIHYLETHKDVATAGVNPFAHYLEQGRKEGRSTKTIETAEPSPKAQRDVLAPVLHRDRRSGKSADRILAETAFDPSYYLAANPDVAAARVDPLDHFLNSGWREGRNPNLWFSVSNYLEFYPDVAEANINPFLHYLMAGKSEGRIPRHDLGFRFDVIASLQPLKERIDHARTSAPRQKVSPAATLRHALEGATRLGTRGLYLSVSHDDFTANFGGVQLVLMRESAAVDSMGFDHLHLFPAIPLTVAEFEDPDPVLGVLLNRERVGYFRGSDIAAVLQEVRQAITDCPLAIHSLIGHRAESLLSIFKAAGCRSGWYWVHDYSSVCTGYTLLRNDVEFCGGPEPTSTACSICVYGDLRAKQMKAHEQLFQGLDLTVLAPSDAALDVWKSSVSVNAPARVHEHLKFGKARKTRTRSKTESARPLRIAYIGQPVTHKGWPVFKELTLRFGEDDRYQFYHVGKGPQGLPAIFKEVAVGPDDLDKMVSTLRDLEIDVAVLWSLWPETFCIAAVEALRAGAAVLTFKDSGNVAAMIRKTGFGAVLDSEVELNALFETGDVAQLVAESRPQGLNAEFSNMTADFIKGRAA